MKWIRTGDKLPDDGATCIFLVNRCITRKIFDSGDSEYSMTAPFLGIYVNGTHVFMSPSQHGWFDEFQLNEVLAWFPIEIPRLRDGVLP